MPESTASLLSHYGPLVVFVNVLFAQLGLPIPAVPVLVLVGSVAAAEQLNPLLIISIAVAASTLADYAWYLGGRRLGCKALNIVFRLCRSPALCACHADAIYERWGAALLLFGKFIPGVGLIAPPLAGLARMPPLIFLLFAGMGGSLWAGTFVIIGYAWGVQANSVFALLYSLGYYPSLTVATVLASYIGYRIVQRWRWAS